MIEQFEAVSYKGLHNFCLGPLQRVNLVTGPNGVGKTCLAEALWLFKGRNPGLLWNLHVQRRAIGAQNPLNGLGGNVHLRGREQGEANSVQFEYEDFQVALGPGHRPVHLQDLSVLPVMGKVRAVYCSGNNETVYEANALLGPSGPALTTPPPSLASGEAIIVTGETAFPIASAQIEQFSNGVARGEKDQMLEVLRLIRPSIKDLEVLYQQGAPSLWANIGHNHLLPLEALGGGITRLFRLTVNFFAARGGLILIDEIENGIHHSVLPELWSQIRQLSKLLDVQVVATTHSFECIQAAVMTNGDDGLAPSDFALHRMYQKDGVPHCITYDDEKLMATLDLGFDIR